MKINNLFICLSVATFCATLAGCVSRSVDELGNGYREVAWTRYSWEQPATQFKLEHTKGLLTTVIWPSLYAYKPVAHDDVVIFIGDAAAREPDPEEPRRCDQRLFAVRAPDLPLDITGEIVRGWALKTGHNVNIYGPRTIVYPDQKGNEVEFIFGISASEHAKVTMDWTQISDIMQEVKEKGVVKKDRIWGYSYIEKEYKPGDQK